MSRRPSKKLLWGLLLFCALGAALALFLLWPESGPVRLDLSRLDRGVVSVRYTGQTEGGLKVQLTRDGGVDYNFDLDRDGAWETFPLTQGDGEYTLTVLEQVEGQRYRPVFTRELTLSLDDPKAPFLESNQFVNYEDTSAYALARRWNGGYSGSTDAEKAAFFFDYVVDHVAYDEAKAASVEPGYLPDVDQVLAEGKGICFDYAALLCALLRSAGVPCKLVVGYSGEVYHAWVEVWCENVGEVDGAIPIEAGEWTLLDPTFVSGQNRSQEILEYVADPSHYSPRYVY